MVVYWLYFAHELIGRKRMIDLHTHTTRSDGTDTPRELINKALSQGVKVLAITDHDTTSSWNEARQSLRGA